MCEYDPFVKPETDGSIILDSMEEFAVRPFALTPAWNKE